MLSCCTCCNRVHWVYLSLLASVGKGARSGTTVQLAMHAVAVWGLPGALLNRLEVPACMQGAQATHRSCAGVDLNRCIV